jgi:hypothetical protein
VPEERQANQRSSSAFPKATQESKLLVEPFGFQLHGAFQKFLDRQSDVRTALTEGDFFASVNFTS